jgi:hypothetical protein
MDERDLTVREIEEAKSWGLKPGDFLKLREKFQRSFMETERKDLREEITKEVYKTAKDAAIKELEERQKMTVPTAEYRAVSREYFRKLETEAIVMAETASRYASRADQEFKRNKLRRYVLGVLGAGVVPIMVATYLMGYTHTSPVFWAVLASIVVTHIWTWARYEDIFTTQESKAHRFAKVTSEYLIVAEAIKRHRIVTVATATSTDDIRHALTFVVDRKERLDYEFTPLMDEIVKGREQARVSTIAAVDAQQVMDVCEELPESVDAPTQRA